MISGEPTLCFVVCPSFHGATLLALLLNNHSSVSALGDTNPSREYDQLCACGERVSRCRFWQTVGERVNDEQFAHLKTFVPSVPSRLPWLWRPGRIAVSEYMHTWNTFYGSVSELHGTRVFVDGSKSARKAVLFANAKEESELRVIHLVRDPRGFVSSWWRNNERISGRALARTWADLHRRMEKLSALLPYKLIRYEDLALEPEAVTRSLQEFIGLEEESLVHAPRDPAKHHLMGNAMIFRFDGNIKTDERWRTELSEPEQRAVLAATGNLAERFGYT